MKKTLGRVASPIDRALPGDARKRVEDHWNEEAGAWHADRGLQWTELRAVELEINRRITGDPLVDPYHGFVVRVVGERRPLGASLTIGCGAGDLERGLVKYGLAERYHGLDISPAAIKRARAAAAREGLDQLSYDVADCNAIELEADAFDVVFGIYSIHHVEALEHLFEQIDRTLRPGGWFLLNEFVGPTRFQWTPLQLRLCRDVLAMLPERLRRTMRDGRLKSDVWTPSIEEMIELDPSESVRSAEIIPLLEERFEIVDRRDYGGTLLQLVLQDIAGRFDPEDQEASEALRGLIGLETTLLESGAIPSDFSFLVCRGR